MRQNKLDYFYEGYTDTVSRQVSRLENKLPWKDYWDYDKWSRSAETRFENVSEEHFKIALDIFMYQNVPSHLSKEWAMFYKNLFETEPVHQIILTLNRMMKNKSEMDANYEMVKTILEKITTALGLKYKEIQSMIPGDGETRNGTVEGQHKMNLTSIGM